MKKSYKIDFVSPVETNIYPIVVRFTGDNYVYDFSCVADTKAIRLFALAFSNRYGGFGVAARERAFHQLRAFLIFANNESIKSIEDIDALLFVKYAKHIDSLNYALNTKYRHYNNLELIMKEIFLLKNSPIIEFKLPPNPFKDVNSETAKPSKLNNKDIELLLKICKEDAQNIITNFNYGQKVINNSQITNSPQTLDEAIYYFFNNYGYVPMSKNIDKTGIKLLRQYGGIEGISQYLHPTVRTLVPFYIILLFELAANSDALRQIRIDCLTDDELLDNRVTIQWEKSRANQIQKRSVLKKGSLGAYELIEFLKLFTSSIRNKINEKERNYLFLCRGESQGNELLFPHRRTLEKGIKQFIKEKELPFTFNPSDIRPSVLTELYKKRRDIFTVSRLANHKNLNTTLSYVVDPETIIDNQKSIAINQDALFDITTIAPPITNIIMHEQQDSWAPGYNCKAPILDKNVCINWMVELTNPNLIIPNNIKYLSRIMKLKIKILEQKSQITPERYEILYHPVISLIDESILPKFSSVLVNEAQELLEEVYIPELDGY